MKDPEVRREEILQVADKVFKKEGFLDSKITKIMSIVGMSQSSFYYYFPSKRDLLIQLARFQSKIAMKKADQIARDKKLTPEEKVVSIFKMHAIAHSLRMRMDRMKDGKPREGADIHEASIASFLKPAAENLALIIEQGVATGSFQVRDAKATALLIVAMSFEILHRAATAEEVQEWKKLRLSLWDAWARLLGMSTEAAERHNPFSAQNEK